MIIEKIAFRSSFAESNYDINNYIPSKCDENQENYNDKYDIYQNNDNQTSQYLSASNSFNGMSKFKSMSDFSLSSEEEEEEYMDEIDEEILNFKPNETVIKLYISKIEKKFVGQITYKTNSLINFVKRNGSSYHAEFFYIILHFLTNQNKFKISSAAKIIDEFITTNSDEKFALYKASKLLNEEKASI